MRLRSGEEMDISKLLASVGKEVQLEVFLTDVKENSGQTGMSWLELMVRDSTGFSTFKIWSEARERLAQAGIYPKELIGKPVSVTGMAELYQNKGEVNVMDISPLQEGSYSLSNFFPAVTENDKSYLKSRLEILIKQVKDESLRSLLEYIFSNGRLEKMLNMCGGTTHHTYLGGLLAHLVQTAESAFREADCSVVGPYRQKVNTDIVIAGALLHDVGKLTTLLEVPGKLSDRGFYVSHATESILFVSGFNGKIAAEKRVKNLAPVIHVIESCHNGKARTQEAILVSQADKGSSRRDAFGLAFYDGSKLERGGTISYSKEMGGYLLKGGEENE